MTINIDEAKDIRVEEYKPDLLDVWERFVDESANGTIFHRQKFISYHPPERFRDNSLLIYYKGRLISVFPAASIDDDGAKVLKSHAGTSYGGPVFKAKESLRRVFMVMDSIHRYAAGQGFDRIEMRTPPKFVYSSFLDQLDFTLVRLGYARETEELATFYSLDDYAYQEDIFEFIKSFPTTSRKEIRKSAEQVTVKVIDSDVEVERYHEILSENLGSKYGKPPVHTVDEIKKLRDLFPGEVFLLGAYYEDKLVGGYTVFSVTDQAMHIFYAALDYEYQIYRPLNFGLARLIQMGIERNMRFVNYGISTEDGGRQINWGLFRFKEDFGGTGALRTYWTKNLAAD